MSDDLVTLKMTETQLSFLVDLVNRAGDDFAEASRDSDNGYTTEDIETFDTQWDSLSEVLANPGGQS